MEKSRRIITLTVACFCFWFWLSAEGRSGCREPQQLQRDCRAVCGKNRLGAVSCELRVAVLLPADSRFDISLLKVLPVLDLAVYEARSRGLLPYWLKLKFFPQDDQCDAMYAQIGAIHSYSNCVHLFLGPACDYCVAVVGRVVKFFGAPLITTGGFTFDFTEKKTEFSDEYFMTTRVGKLAFRDLAQFLVALMNRYSWRKVNLVYATNGQSRLAGRHTCQLMMKSMVEFIRKQQNFTYGTFDVEATTLGDYPEAMRDHVGNWYGVIVMCANSTTIREILLAAEELGMVDSGEYVFFSIDLTSSDNDSKEPWKVEGDTDERNEKARKAYQALLTVTARTPDNLEYLNFSREVKSLAQSKYNFTFGSSSVSTFVTAFYDAVLLYALALKESLPEQPGPGEVNLDGGNLTRRMWGRTFKGITGDVNIDENGDRIADYSLLDMDPETSKFQIVAHYYGANKTLEYVPGKRIHWSGGRTEPPPDTPTCGFDGSLCPDNSLPGYAILSIVLSSIVVALLVASVFIYRHFKLEAEIASMTWKVHWEDITVMAHAKTRGSVYSLIVNKLRGSQLTIYSDDNMSLPDGADRHVYIPTGIYKNSKVAIKSIPRKKVEISRPLLLELKRMKDLQHDHLVRFYGACLEPPHCCLLTEYCPKGSLQDILENEQFKLDRVFRFSLIHDIVRGMAYLHASEVRSHGNLKSSNCVVDSRFVLKIADFGLHELRSPCPGRTNVDLDPDPEDNGDVDENSYAYWKKQLWTAPELLRMERRPAEGTQKGDVYSFAIIVHEIVVRQGPFYLGVCFDFSPKEIVEGVKRGGGSPMRPAIDEATVEEEVANLMRRCWAQDAADRPDFPALKQTIRKINKDYESSNILDNLLSRMEQYATNLETLVEERTTDYFEEKRKCEELLYQLLPKSVASQLILGQSVIAETYDQVTIYFSDIVGFTSLSAESTPLQVVDLLNDLYTCFDSIIEHFDVYKVETIGDAYMVVSGLPVRNGTNHAREIARMSLALRDTVMTFRIRHRPNEQLKLRIGMHSGPCVAGVVGLKMPRYCLFGDTVNTASRMESNGEALKIHVSPKTKEILDTFGTFDLVCRGEVTLKGKGRMTTYWLLGEKSTCDEICRVPVSSATETPATGTGITTSTATVTATAASTVTTTATTTARTNATTTSMTSSGRTTSSATLTTITIAAAPVSRSNAGNESTVTRTTSATATTVTTVTTATTTVAVRPVAKACSRIGAIEQREEENVRSRNPERPSNRLSSQRLMDQERQQPRPIQRRIRYHRRQTSSPSRRIGDDADDKNKGADNDVNDDDDDDDDDDNDDDDDDSEGVSGDGGESENVAVSPSQRSRRTSERLPNHAETSPNSPFLVATRSTGTVPRV